MAIFGRKTRVDDGVEDRPFLAVLGDLLSTFEHGSEVDINLSKLLGYIYILDNKGKVDRRSTGVDSSYPLCLLPRKFARYVYLSTHAKIGMFRGGKL